MKYQSDSNFLQHYGIKGQKWYMRRFQNLDGSYTKAGKERYGARNRRKDLIGPFKKAEKDITRKLSNTPQPISKRPSVLNHIQERGHLTKNEAVKCAELADNLFDHAAEIEPQITSDVISSAMRSGSKMYGLEYRLKQPTSLASKIGADAKEKDISLEESAREIKDTIRYTSVSSDKNFVSNYQQMKKELEAKGYSETRCKNYFQLFHEGQARHKAVQCIFFDPNENVFEIQFQTKSSQAAKELKLPLYNERRQLDTSDERKAYLEREMIDLADFVPYPPNYMQIQSHG